MQIGSAGYDRPPNTVETRVWLTSCPRGDLDGSGVFGRPDLPAFYEALNTPMDYGIDYPGLLGSRVWHGDMNGDLAFDVQDVDPFLLCVTDPEAYFEAYPDPCIGFRLEMEGGNDLGEPTPAQMADAFSRPSTPKICQSPATWSRSPSTPAAMNRAPSSGAKCSRCSVNNQPSTMKLRGDKWCGSRSGRAKLADRFPLPSGRCASAWGPGKPPTGPPPLGSPPQRA